MATVSFLDSDTTDLDIVVRQFVWPLAPGQTVTGAQAIEWQVRAQRGLASDTNMATAIGIRVIASNGVTVRKTVLAVTRDGTAISAVGLENRRFTATSVAGDYTTVAGDYLVVEIGGGGGGGISDHDFDLRLGDAAASDLPEDDTDTTDKRPWIEFADTLTVDPPHPFIQSDWSIPKRYRWGFGTPPAGAPDPPFRQNDWPLPNRVPYFPVHVTGWFTNADWINVTRWLPFRQTEWPLPNRVPYFPVNVQGWDASGTGWHHRFGAPDPFRQADWPNPQPKPYVTEGRAYTDGWNQMLGGGGTAFPFQQTEWPNPQIPRTNGDVTVREQGRLALGIAPPVAPPFVMHAWPNPLIPQQPVVMPTPFWPIATNVVFQGGVAMLVRESLAQPLLTSPELNTSQLVRESLVQPAIDTNDLEGTP